MGKQKARRQAGSIAQLAQLAQACCGADSLSALGAQRDILREQGWMPLCMSEEPHKEARRGKQALNSLLKSLAEEPTERILTGASARTHRTRLESQPGTSQPLLNCPMQLSRPLHRHFRQHRQLFPTCINALDPSR